MYPIWIRYRCLQSTLDYNCIILLQLILINDELNGSIGVSELTFESNDSLIQRMWIAERLQSVYPR